MAEWKEVKIKDIAESMGDAPFGTSLKTEDYIDSGVLVVQGKNIQGRVCDWTDRRYVSLQKYKSLSRSHCFPGDLIFPKVGTIGKVGILTPFGTQKEYILSTNTMTLRPNEQIACRDFVYYYFSSPQVVNLIQAMNSKSVQPVFNFTSLRDFQILLPPIHTQRRIADILGALDDKIQCNRRINQTLEAMAQALYKHWFVDSSETETQPLTSYIEIDPTIKIFRGIETPYVDMKALPTNSMSVSEVVRRSFTSGSKFQNGDTLFARITPCLENGKTAFVDFLEDGEAGFGSTEFIVFRAKPNVSPQFVYCCARDENLRAHAVKSMVGTSGRQRVRTDCFSHHHVKTVREESMQAFHTQTATWFRQIRANVKENSTLAQTRDYLLPKLLSGEVELREAEEVVEAAV